eukprot:TRINITY_DN30971_c0_g1_i1.p1 TRINITY_DN30971_c0_g1~~TRINITY_DN30971_c0_g1_i1.p1  ORF type:complete len:525 (-),score=119.08 TRINITY_DN30971_c0_g1_i1:33-1607(-)
MARPLPKRAGKGRSNKAGGRTANRTAGKHARTKKLALKSKAAKTAAVGGVALAEGEAASSFESLRPGLRRLVDRGCWPGVAACIFVDGQPRLLEETGFADLETKEPMTSKSLVRIYSMTKCVVAAAVLQLVDAGLLGLDDKLSDYVPAFAKMSVVLEDKDGLPDLNKIVPARRPITIRHLLTHTSGIASHYASGIDGPKRRSRKEMAWSNLYKDLVAKVDSGEISTLDAWVDELAKLPLWSQPGACYGYGYSYDILGHIVELKTGKTLAAYLRERIFEPLGMRDTRFDLAALSNGSPTLRRLSALYRFTKSAQHGSDGRRTKLVRVDPPRRSAASSAWTRACELPSGGGALSSFEGGLLSTLDDYSKFLLAATSGGAHPISGARILSRKMATELLADQTLQLKPRAGVFASPYNDRGLGLSCMGEMQRKGCPEWGQWFDGVPGVRLWGGAASTAFKYDPNAGKPILVVLMAQAFPQDDGATITAALRGTRAVLAAEKEKKGKAAGKAAAKATSSKRVKKTKAKK